MANPWTREQLNKDLPPLKMNTRQKQLQKQDRAIAELIADLTARIEQLEAALAAQ